MATIRSHVWGLLLLVAAFATSAPVLYILWRFNFGDKCAIPAGSVSPCEIFGMYDAMYLRSVRSIVICAGLLTLVVGCLKRSKRLCVYSILALIPLVAIFSMTSIQTSNKRKQLLKRVDACNDLKELAPWVLQFERERGPNLGGKITAEFVQFCEQNQDCPADALETRDGGIRLRANGSDIQYSVQKQEPFAKGLWSGFAGNRSTEALRDMEPKFGKGPDYFLKVKLTSSTSKNAQCVATENSLPDSFFKDRRDGRVPAVHHLGPIEAAVLKKRFPHWTFTRVIHRYRVGSSPKIFSQLGTIGKGPNAHVSIWSDDEAASFLNEHRTPNSTWTDIKDVIAAYAALAGYAELPEAEKFISSLEEHGVCSFPYTASWKVLPEELRRTLFLSSAFSERLTKPVSSGAMARGVMAERGISLDVSFLTYAPLECYSRDRLLLTPEGGIVVEDTAFLFCAYPDQ